MAFEVELKYPLSHVGEFKALVEPMRSSDWFEEVQTDTYFNHPVRDFAQSDEAVRIRCSNKDVLLTYKGPLLDSVAKTRKEIELPVGEADGNPEQLAEMLTALSFRPVRRVHKKRQTARLNWNNQLVTLSIDQVEGLGAFCELELVTDEDAIEQARDILLQLAGQLELNGPVERRSYLQLLIEKETAE